LGSLNFALFGEVAANENETVNNSTFYEEETSSDTGQTIGAGFGVRTKNSHFELSYEKALTGSKGTRISGTAEMIWGKLTLGYTGRIYSENFQDRKNIIYNQLAFNEEDPITGNRFE